MLSVKRLLQVSAFAVCVMSSTVVLAADDSAQPESPSLQEGIDFGALFTPEPVNKSCTATSQCTPVGGVPVSCVGVTTCSSAGNWVTCDNQITYCTCYAPGVPTCYNPTGFCACWEQYHNWQSCRVGYCFEP